MPEQVEQVLGDAPKDPGSIRFYGLYWRRDKVNFADAKLLGQPGGWVGKGKVAGAEVDRQMNFWRQKGVYILYSGDLQPVYAGQVGLARANAGGGRVLGERIGQHATGVYRNGWTLFSWFGFLSTAKINLRNAGEAARLQPEWTFEAQGDQSLNNLLASFEAVLIEGFAPRFNARGGDLGKAVFVNQFEG
jgi:hypothetical protein